MKRFVLLLLLAAGTAAAQKPTPNLSECRLSHVQGTYVAAYQGWMLNPTSTPPMQFPVAIMGVLSFGPSGAVSGAVTAIYPSGKVTNEVLPGSVVDIKPDCTGTGTFSCRRKGSADPPTNEIHRFVYLRETGEFQVIMEDVERGGAHFVPMILGSWKLMAKGTNEAEW